MKNLNTFNEHSLNESDITTNWNNKAGRNIGDRRIRDVWDAAIGGEQPDDIDQMKSDILEIIDRDELTFEEIEKELRDA